MKITFLLPAYPWKPLGGLRTVYEHANNLVDSGHTVNIVHTPVNPKLEPSSPVYDKLRRKAGYVRNLLLYGKVRMFPPDIQWQAIDKRIKMLYVPHPAARYVPDSDVVIATFWPTAEYVADYPSGKGKKFYFVQDFYPYLGTRESIESSWKLPLKKIAISTWLYGLALQSGVKKEDIIVAPCGIDLKRFTCTNDIVKRPRKIGMFYSTVAYKAPEDGLKAIEIVKAQYPDVEVVFYGPQRRPAGIPHSLQYYSNIPEAELIELYNGCSLFLSSSIAEGFALPPAEAMACGCAVVATDSGGIREYARHEVNALISPPRDPDALAKNLIRLLQNDTMRIELAKRGQELIQEFTWKHSTDILMNFIIKN